MRPIRLTSAGKEKEHASRRKAGNIGGMGKQIVHTLVEREGTARSHHVANINGKTLRPILTAHVSQRSALMTNTAVTWASAKSLPRHAMVDHGIGEYVRG